jgi:hypothetical protein
LSAERACTGFGALRVSRVRPLGDHAATDLMVVRTYSMKSCATGLSARHAPAVDAGKVNNPYFFYWPWLGENMLRRYDSASESAGYFSAD